MRIILPVFLVLLLASCQFHKPLKNRKNFTVSHSLHNPSLNLPDYIPHSSQVIFEITDVNPYIYNIAFTEMQRDVITDMELSANNFSVSNKAEDFDIAAIDIGGFSMLDEGGNEATEKGEGGSAEDFEMVSKKLKKERDMKMKRQDSIAILKTRHDELNNDTITAMSEKQASISRIKEEIMLLNQRIKENEMQIDDLTLQRSELMKNMQNDTEKIRIFQSQLGYYIAVANEIRSTLSFYKDLQTLLHTNMTFNELEIAKNDLMNQYFSNTQNVFQYCNGLTASLEDEYNYVVKSFNNISDKKKVNYTMNVISNYHSKMKGKNFDNLFVEIESLLKSIKPNNWKYQYQTTALSDKADKISFELAATPRISSYSKVFYPIKYNYNFHIKGGIKVDVSAGLFWNMGMGDEEFQLEEFGDSTKVYSLNPTIGTQPTFGTLFNIYRRSNSQIKPSLNVGVGTDIEKVYYYFGGGLMLGRSERVSINAGAVGGTVFRIPKRYRELDNVFVPNSIDQVITDIQMQSRNEFKVGWFLGVSYNLSGKGNAGLESNVQRKGNSPLVQSRAPQSFSEGEVGR